MCLKKYIEYTFSNKEAFERLIPILKDEYGTLSPKGKIYIEIYIVHSYRDWGKKYIDQHYGKRDNLTYDNLQELLEMFYSPINQWDYLDFSNWKGLKSVEKKVKKEEDVFGKIRIEVQ